MPLATSKNLTIMGIAGILSAVASAALALFDGDPSTNVDWGLFVTTIWLGVTNILAKGQSSTGTPTPTTP